ncbi:hypothetical protein AVEN_17928-1 [Araneus ventricosus]|uniref:Uncharacterized protein n=1 Tax=Araneus ventricosus TaxID=182803 RepID=A0A4Y2G3V0_ARAVE|nr:hypothetical protein AVEN_17928-1 [Araneus ventricosus]
MDVRWVRCLQLGGNLPIEVEKRQTTLHPSLQASSHVSPQLTSNLASFSPDDMKGRALDFFPAQTTSKISSDSAARCPLLAFFYLLLLHVFYLPVFCERSGGEYS